MPRAPALFLSLLLLAGCAEVEEGWVFDERGGGEYALSVRWDADLWRRVGGIVGEAVMERVRGRAFPLRVDEMAETLRGLPGVEVLSLQAGEGGAGGMRSLDLRVRFERLADLLAWEPMAGRPLRVSLPAPDGEERRVRLEMRPFDRLPVLDPVLRAWNEFERPPAGLDEADVAADPGPLARLGVGRREADLVADLLRPALAKLRVALSVAVPGPVATSEGPGARHEGTRARWELDAAALRDAGTGRGVAIEWRLRALDRIEALEQEGAAPPVGAHGR
jgi:hypothetical protein